jgi:proline dehydrogenase
MNSDPKLSFDNLEVAFASKSDARLRKMHLIFGILNNQLLMNAGKALTKLGLKLRLPIKGIIRKTVFDHFCGGETIADCQLAIAELNEYRIGTILDYSVEGEKTENSFDHTTAEIIRTIENAAGNANIPFSVFKVTGLASSELLEKIQAKKPLSEKEVAAFQKVRERVDAICAKAKQLNVPIFIDGEESWMQEVIDSLTYEMMEKYNAQNAIVYNTYQMYRHDMLGNLKDAFEVAKEKGYILGAKLVRGAYMEKERERAAEMAYPSPIQPNKKATDADYDQALKFCVDHIDKIRLCSGSHNEQSNYYLSILIEKTGLAKNDPRIYFAQLYGMSDNISYNLAQAGYNVAKYVPYGPVRAVMPYLFRRAEENTSIAGQSSREFALISRERKRRKEASRKSA